MDLILEFSEIDGSMLPIVGGKAANLGVMTRAGLPVPPGLCLTTEAYRRVASGLSGDPSTMRKQVLEAPVPDDLAEVIRATATGPVAVRSSATAEDLPYASFAGQQDTFLNVIGADAVLAAVRRCWASLWTDRAISYREANGIDHGSVRLAVVIQSMVDAHVAGVMFTANPVTGTRRQAVIDAAPGLGEAVVSGSVNPDHFVVDLDTGRVLERRLGDKLTSVRSLPGGGVEHVASASDDACVTDEQLRALAALGAEVEGVYGAPQDTEWAIDADGKLWLTQARPITTLFPIPEGPSGMRVFFNFSLAQGVYPPLTPMGISAFRALSSGISGMFGSPVASPLGGAPVFTEAAGRVFADLTPVIRSKAGRAIVPRVFDLMEARSAEVMRGLFDDPRFSVTQPSMRPFLRRVARIAFRYRIPPRVLRALVDPAGARRRASSAWPFMKERLTPPPASASVRERVDHVARMLYGPTMPSIIPRMAPALAAGLVSFGLAARLLRGTAGGDELQAVLRGLPYNVTTEMDLALWHLAEEIRQDPALTARFLSTPPAELAREPLPILSDFLRTYGDRAVAEIDIGVPRWSEDPTHVIGMIANYLRLEDASLAPSALFTRGATEAEAAIATLARRTGGARGRLVRFLLGRTRELAGVRELPKYTIIRVLAALRAQLLDIGATLTAEGELDAPADIFYLTLQEARTPADYRSLVQSRKDTQAQERRRRHLPRILLSDGTEPEAVATASAPADGALTGTPASPGVVTGVARVVMDPMGAHLEPGEILVCPSTDPGWTPLFLTAGGLVMEMGGANSHGAVVAREYGIPAVVGVAGATDRIETGHTITLDGTSGTVTSAVALVGDDLGEG
ncbi:PEP/pyruvate-binding domain-containing protein [Nonomuraea sp. NPDC050556]|uniref:PEP/pyruvate-binding domain-containing protein n=1 Tax=Nonomuraea sp. NPDC050556 TaxID=3364369 RepID=UPI0037A0A041